MAKIHTIKPNFVNLNCNIRSRMSDEDDNQDEKKDPYKGVKIVVGCTLIGVGVGILGCGIFGIPIVSRTGLAKAGTAIAKAAMGLSYKKN